MNNIPKEMGDFLGKVVGLKTMDLFTKFQNRSYSDCVLLAIDELSIKDKLLNGFFKDCGANTKERVEVCAKYVCFFSQINLFSEFFCLTENLMKSKRVDITKEPFFSEVKKISEKSVVKGEPMTNYDFIKFIRNGLSHDDPDWGIEIISKTKNTKLNALRIENKNNAVEVGLDELLSIAQHLAVNTESELVTYYDFYERRLENSLILGSFSADRINRFLTLKGGAPVPFDEHQKTAISNFFKLGSTIGNSSLVYLDKIAPSLKKRKNEKNVLWLNMIYNLKPINKSEMTDDCFEDVGGELRRVNYGKVFFDGDCFKVISLAIGKVLVDFLPSYNEIEHLLSLKAVQLCLLNSVYNNPDFNIWDVMNAEEKRQKDYIFTIDLALNSNIIRFLLASSALRDVLSKIEDPLVLAPLGKKINCNDFHHVRNALAHGSYFFDYDDAIKIYDGSKKKKYFTEIKGIENIIKEVASFQLDKIKNDASKLPHESE